ncbi:PTS system, nitrogen regulatory IIA-like protein [Bibersteinia trehalosi USDA-ARS-USMARC-188]|uniref:PTS system, nitrogen regulatory IIA-like protein n=5 Tax=Bibersteinia trehalosi TaxID=47735 RepID=W0R500_BIBTR|nr:PTS sugar transporter subunit IIA [Bibersteinia trehalosi]AGH38204.1 PTS system, nitrogen regulatory IIA-like protein [Bibersteinia trehalosi USDA-ARS-USMARC-192]AHG81995.1 PTS system, nitrogen regulatory IIA-like protein [Bibersteinia trehalosi USDA-ARS-USMARC-188]AHG84299.1 PTS system, nitrogen regulatory IIA-like protein [Bibersteinia trehalosi USDA-ARS-USMARC-189]AHG86194.1 PTS system, nitrogen regulatory IIA-like protein [Bibersteinia trehalosi USDA-ARS-USMARC-190]OAQ15276.1 PTS sugar 
MKLTEFLTPENIRLGVAVSSKKRALELVGEVVADYLNQQQDSETGQNLCPVACFTNLFKREKLGSTGINQGVALPHAKLPENSCASLPKPVAVFLKLEEPIEFEASDNKHVDLIYALLFPEDCCGEYKNKLPEIAQLLGDKALLKQLRAAESADDIWQILDRSEIQQNESEN